MITLRKIKIFFKNKFGKKEHYPDYWIPPYSPTEKRVFTIPVGGMTREEAEEQVRNLMNSYNEEIDWDIKFDESKYEGKRIFSEIDPYGEEIWDYDEYQKILIDESRLIYNRCGPHHPRRIFTIPIGNDLSKFDKLAINLLF